MKREEIADLMAFVVVAEERSFTRAAARLSMAQSALSQIVRRIDRRTIGIAASDPNHAQCCTH